jgi:hypothetical protein
VLLEPLGDLAGHDVVEQRVGLGLRGAGQMQGVEHHQEDDGHQRHRRQAVDLVHEGGIGLDDGGARGKAYQVARWQASATRRDRRGELDAGDAEDGKRHRRGAEIVQLDAAFAAQIGDEIEDGGEDDGAEPEAAAAGPMRWNSGTSAVHRAENDVADHQRPQQVPAVQGIVQGIGQRRHAGEIAGDVGDDEPAAGLGVVVCGAGGDETPGDIGQPTPGPAAPGPMIAALGLGVGMVDHARALPVAARPDIGQL